MFKFSFKKKQEINLDKKDYFKEKISEYNKKYNAPYGLETNDDDSNIILSKNYSIGTNNKLINSNVLVVGMPGCGKTISYITPNVLQLSGNYIVVDVNNIIYNQTEKIYENEGYIIKRYNPNNKDVYYNPFKYLRTEKDIITMVNILLMENKGTSRDPFFEASEKSLLVGLIGYMNTMLPKSEQNFNKLLELLNENDFDGLFITMPNNLYKRNYEMFNCQTYSIQQSTKISCARMIEPLENYYRIKEDELNFQDFKNKKTILYLSLDSCTSESNFMAVLLITQLYNYLISDYIIENEEADIFSSMHKHKRPKSIMEYPVHFIIDEASIIGKIPTIQEMLLTSNAHNIQISIIAQNFALLKKCYSGYNFEELISLFDTILYLGGAKLETELINYLNTHNAQLYNNTLPLGKCIILTKGLDPIIDDTYDLVHHKRYELLDY